MLRRLAFLTAVLALGISASAQAAPSIQSYPRPDVADIATASDGNTWITMDSNKVARIVSGNPPTVTEFSTGLAAAPSHVAPGPDGRLWYVSGAQLGRINPATGTAAAPIALAGLGVANPTGLATGPDGNMWIVAATNIRRVDAAGAAVGALIPHGLGGGERQITAGPDGNMYVAGNDATARVNTGGSTVLANAGGGQQQGITAGPDGNIYPASTSNLTRLTPGGAFTNFPAPGTDTFDAAPGPDGAVWFAQFASKTIARLGPNGAVSTVGPTTIGPRRIAMDLNTKEMWFAADTVGQEGIGVVRGIDIPVAPPAGGGAGAAGTPAVVTPDTVKPTISSLRVDRTKKKVSLTLSETARLTLTYERKVRGRRVKGKCKEGAKQGKRCSLFKRAATRTAQGRAGVNTFTIPSAARKAGFSYRLTATAIDAAGNRSLASRTSYRVPAKKP